MKFAREGAAALRTEEMIEMMRRFSGPEKLTTGREIAAFLGWHWRKLYRYMPEMKKAGVCWIEYQGRPPKKRICSMKTFILQWMMLKIEHKERL
jgi:predicted DNA-binding transcriptional regulator YafY